MKKNILKKKAFHHLDRYARDRIQALLSSGHTQSEIASVLLIHKSTVSREIRKRKRRNGYYEAATAEHKASIKRSNSKHCGMKIEKYPVLRDFIIAELQKKNAPETIAGRMKKEGMFPRISSSAIYKWLYSVSGQQYCQYLCTRRYKPKKQKKFAKREMIPDRVSLRERPLEGIHAEGDLFVSPTKTGSTKSGAVVCILETKLLFATFIPNKKPLSMQRAIRTLLHSVPIDDLILDNGIENRYHKSFGLPVYFADPHSPWQKPHIENSIGLLRKWFIPKGTDLKNVSEEELQGYIHILNSKYRKSLGYRSAYEVSRERGIL